MIVTRYASADAFLAAAQPLLMLAEAENNLILGVAQGMARNPSAARGPYLATVGNCQGLLACAVHIAPYKLVITRANREPIVALARDAFEVIPHVEGVTGPSRSASDFALAWSQLSGVDPVLGKRLRIHETRKVVESPLPCPPGQFREATPGDRDQLAAWTEVFVAEAKIPDAVDSSRIVADAIDRGRLHVWQNGQPVSMAAWTGKTPSGVRINFVYTPRELRGRGYGTACVSSLTRKLLEQGNAFCWLYTDLSSGASPNIFKRIGYWPVSDVAEYYLRQSAVGSR
ncbi:MAG TPA: GNAT family N-acetyltransferase [Vicinamibacterales bacterium]|nr:GNAT family N-acetyltransferase [Vicinamibacterales bacterium]